MPDLNHEKPETLPSVPFVSSSVERFRFECAGKVLHYFNVQNGQAKELNNIYPTDRCNKQFKEIDRARCILTFT